MEKFPGLNRKKSWRKSDPLERILQDWYGKKTAKNEIIAYLPQPEPINNAVNQALKKLVNKETAFIQKVRLKWKEIAGDQLAAYTTPVSFGAGNSLFVEVSHSIWLMQLKKYDTSLLLKNIVEYTGDKFCKKIKFVPKGAFRTNFQ
jgi:hypothetical protein